jgi:hypothetical protein
MEPQIDSVHEGKKLSKFPHTWNYKLTGNVHKGGMIPNSPWNLKLTGKVHKGKVISIFPPPRNYKLTGNVHTGKMISKFPPPWNFKLTSIVL